VRSPLDPFLDEAPPRGGVVILDGGLATELERRGADLGDALWSARLLVDAPERISEVHLAYFEAGADVATSASYQATFEGFAGRGLGRTEAAALMRTSVALAAEARDRYWQASGQAARAARPLIAASVGSYGAALADGSEYCGDFGLGVEELVEFHRPRLEVLARTDADLIACETIPSLAEVEALVRVLEEFPERPAWIALTCKDDRHVGHGEPFEDCIALAASCKSVVAVGLNCTAPRHVDGLLCRVEGCPKPLCVYPNSGEAWEIDSSGKGHWQARGAASDFGIAARRWHAAGARLVGGCCRTTPDDIRRIRAALLGPGTA
jgi:homocysteine S-methyltransferase